MSGFLEKLGKCREKNNSLVCVGLDSELERIPAHLQSDPLPQLAFNKAIIDATQNKVSSYKANSAFYEAQGSKGLEALQATVDYIPDHIPFILDAKRGDIGNTSRLYAQAAFDSLGADAVTIHAYMGTDTVAPFLEYSDRAIFVLLKTSNPSSGEFQDIQDAQGEKLFMRLASKVAEWNSEFPGCCGVVAGATYPKEIGEIRKRLPDIPILIPGLGKQGGDARATVQMSANEGPVLIHSARGIIFASDGTDFAKVAGEKAEQMRIELNSYLER